MKVQRLIDELYDIPLEGDAQVEVGVNGIGLMIQDDDGNKYFIELDPEEEDE